MRYAVVIVNWNGAADTVECLASFVAGSPEAVAIVVDNGSVDGSVASIAAALRAQGIEPVQAERAGGVGAAAPTAQTRAAARAVLVEAGENLGFAAGCNRGLRVAQAAGLEVCVFLNNDTVVEPHALDLLVQRLEEAQRSADPRTCFACLPMITVAGTGRIWNCGGEVYAVGLRRYHLAGRPRAEGEKRPEIACSFFTGCCFAVRTADFAARGGFSERFFFGEEDFELALWMKDRGLAAVCLTAAVVQHKVSASFSRAAAIGHGAQGGQGAKVFVYYLNRFIHMRLRLGLALWAVWVAAYLPYTALLLWRGGVVRAAELPSFIGTLLRRSRAMDGVTRADFEALMQGWAAPVPASRPVRGGGD